MNYLVPLDAFAGELEKILSGIKTMLVKEYDPAFCVCNDVSRGDSLYFLKSKDEFVLRVKATVMRVLPVMDALTGELPQILKEMQPKLQLTEDQYNYWSARRQILLVEFNSAHKISAVHVAVDKITDRSGWLPFEEFGLIS